MQNNDSQTNSRPICSLPPFLINQIKAGEVIERPANLLKELIENSIDSQADKIEITIQNSGLDLVQIRDNGQGMTFENLPKAFERHSTSKLSSFNELYQLHTFGFRGEALASIASTSHVECTSFSHQNDSMGGKIKIEGGKIVKKIPMKARSLSSGTTMIVKNLFFNTPARLKFIKSSTIEKNATLRFIKAFLISNYNIFFTIKWDDKDREVYEKTYEHLRRIKQVLYPKGNIPNPILEGTTSYQNYKLQLFIAPSASKTNLSLSQFILVNNRVINEPKIHHLTLQILQKNFPDIKYWSYCLLFHAPTQDIDINVHPRKTSIKFKDINIILSLLSSEIKKIIGGLKQEAAPKASTESPNFSSMEATKKQLNELLSVSPHPLAPSYREDEKSNILQWSNPRYSILSLSENRSSSHLLSIGKAIYLFIQVKDLEQHSPLPLLVSCPFKVETSYKENILPLVEYLLTLGLELDWIDQDTLLLRSIPSYFKDLPYVNFLQQMFKFRNSYFTKDLKLFMQRFFHNEFQMEYSKNTEYLIKTIIRELGLPKLMENQAIILITEKTFDQLFRV